MMNDDFISFMFIFLSDIYPYNWNRLLQVMMIPTTTNTTTTSTDTNDTNYLLGDGLLWESCAP